MQETWVLSLGWEDLLEEGLATYSSILAWRIPMARGAWGVAVQRVMKSRTHTLQERPFEWETCSYLFFVHTTQLAESLVP